jgi:hypothetical protein
VLGLVIEFSHTSPLPLSILSGPRLDAPLKCKSPRDCHIAMYDVCPVLAVPCCAGNSYSLGPYAKLFPLSWLWCTHMVCCGLCVLALHSPLCTPYSLHEMLLIRWGWDGVWDVSMLDGSWIPNADVSVEGEGMVGDGG